MAESLESYYPLEIQRNDGGALRILWNDGRACFYAYSNLRRVCPCATCGDLRTQQQEAAKNPFQTVTTVTTEDVQPVHLSTVGHYALGIEWDDGHRTGIYPLGHAAGAVRGRLERLLAHQPRPANTGHQFLALIGGAVLEEHHPGVRTRP